MKKFIFLLVFVLSISNTFAILTSKEKLVIQDTFFKYEINISKLTQKEQIDKVEKLIQSIDNLLETNKVKNNVLLYDMLTELKNLAEDKHNILTQNNTSKYVETPGMKTIICEQLGICEIDTNDNISNENYGDNTFTSTSLEVSLNFASPQSQSVPSSGIITFGKFDFTANGNDITISSITLERGGLSLSRDIKRIYFEKNGTRISNTTSITSDNKATIIFSPALVVNRGSTYTLDLVGELNTNSGAGGEYRFIIQSSNDIETNVKVVGIFPIRTNSMQATSYSVGKVDITNNNISNNYSPGKINTVIGSFKVLTPENDKYIFQSIKLRNSGTANTNLLASIGLYRDGKEVSSNVSINGRELTINLYDTILANQTANYELRADMVYCKGYDYETNYDEDYEYYRCENMTNEYYKIEIRNSYDINIIEEWSGYSPSINIIQ